MARVKVANVANGAKLACGFNTGNEFSGSAAKVSRGRLRGGLCASVSAVDVGDGHIATWTLTPFVNPVYIRMYIRVRAYPSAGGTEFFGVKNSIEGGGAGGFYVESDGRIFGYSRGNDVSNTAIGNTTTGLSLNQWYRVNIFVNINNKVMLQVDGAADPGNDTNAAFAFSANFAAGGAFAGLTTGFGFSGALVSQLGVPRFGSNGPFNGGEIDVTDLVVDDAAAPGPGAVSLLHITGPGNYVEWTTGGDWRSLISVQEPRSGATAPVSLTNTTLGAKCSFTVEPLTNKMPSNAVIKSVRVSPRGAMVRNDWKFLIRKNGVDTESALRVAEAVSDQWKGTTAFGWDPEISISPTDSIEIGVIDGPSGAGTSNLHGMVLQVDWEGSDPVYPADNEDIEIASGTYTGNGVTQDVSVGFKPTFLIVKPISANHNGAWWHRGMAEDGEWSLHGQTHSAAGQGIQRVYATGFSVKGSASANPGVNDSGVTYGWVAIRDLGERMIATMGRCSNPGGNTLDNYNLKLDDPDFVVEAAIVAGQRNGLSGGNHIHWRGPSHVGDSSTSLDSALAPQADYIQSLGTGQVQLGSGLVGNLSPDSRHAVAAFRTTEFTQKTLLAMGRYTGDNAASRVIPFSLSTDPSFLMIIPTNTVNRRYRFYNDGQGTTSRAWNSIASDTTGITAFATPNEFTVGTGLNATGVAYDWFVFGSGVDLAVTPEITVPREGFVGLTWVEFLDAQNNYKVWGKVALPDPADYYHGFKDDRVQHWGTIRRGMSDRLGNYDSSSFSWTANDKDRTIRALLANPLTQYFPSTPVTARMIDDPSRRQLFTPRTMFKGVVDGYKPMSDLLFDFKAIDPISKKFSLQDGLKLPQRRITLEDFPDCPEKNINRGVPIIYGALSDDIKDTEAGGGGNGTASGPVEVRSVGGVPGGHWPFGLGFDDPETGNQYRPGQNPDILADGSFFDGLDADHRSWRQRTGAVDPPINIDADTVAGGDLPDHWRGGPQRFSFFVTSVHNGIESEPSKVVVAEAGSGTAGRRVTITWTETASPPNQGYKIYMCNNPFYVSPKFSRLGWLDGKFVMVGSNYVRVKSVGAGVTTVNFDSDDDGSEANFQKGFIYKISAVFADGSESAPSGEIAALSHPYLRPIQLRWRIYTNAVGYKIYRRPGGQSTPDRVINVGPNGMDGIQMIDGEEQVRYFDDFDDTNDDVQIQTVPPPPGGVYRVIPVGTENISGTVWTRFLVAGHACKVIGNVYRGGQKADATGSIGYGINILCPGKPGWPHPNNYVDINDRRYTLIYAKDEVATEALDGTRELTVNVDGIEDVGNGSGALITDLLDQYKHFMKNWVLQSYQGGNWLSTPMFPDETELPMIDEASFDAAKAVAAIRIAGGYVGAWAVGVDGEILAVRDVIARLNVSGDVDCYFNRKTQFAVSMEAENVASINNATILDDKQDIFVRSFSIEDRLNEHFNVIPYFYARDYSGRTKSFSFQAGQTIETEGGWLAKDEISDQTSITKYRQSKRSADINLWAIRSQAIADDIAMRRLRRTKNPPRYVRFTVGLQGLNHEIGDIVKITHHEGIGANGWLNNPIRITKHEVDPEEFTVVLEGYDMNGLFATAFILGDESVLPALWTNANALQRFYGYLCDETTGQFSDGANGKRLV